MNPKLQIQEMAHTGHLDTQPPGDGGEDFRGEGVAAGNEDTALGR